MSICRMIKQVERSKDASDGGQKEGGDRCEEV